MKDNTEVATRKVMKRSGKLVNYEPYKIARAIEMANNEELREDHRLSEPQIDEIVDIVSSIVFRTKRDLSVEEIQDLVQEEIAKRSYPIFLLYHDYRFVHQQARNINEMDDKIRGIVEVIRREDGSIGVENEEVKRENANKDTTIASVQRDYIAGEWNRYYTNEHLLPADIKRAHSEGIIHFHDTDFFAMHITNCCLVNLDDMLTNGTAISGTKIDPPKSFLTAATITSQIVSQVSSSQYGGQTWTLSHLVPFVDISRQKIRRRKEQKFKELGLEIEKEKMNKLVESELIEELESGCQTIQYQLITIQTTNGQAPFVTEFMYLNEVPEGRERDDLALLIEITLKQRILGVKDKSGCYVTPAFPKLIYVLQEDNLDPGSKYYYLTELAAKCSAKRLVPDYISEKKMKELKKGDVYPPMGCVDGNSIIKYILNGKKYVEGFKRAWSRAASVGVIESRGGSEYIRVDDMQIWDNVENRYVNVECIIRNKQSNWCRVSFTGGRMLEATTDHPFEIIGKGVVHAGNLVAGDKTYKEIAKCVINKDELELNESMWFKGLLICDGCYSASRVTISLGMDEEDIVNMASRQIMLADYECQVKYQHRGVKGDYVDVAARKSSDWCRRLAEEFGGYNKADRVIPSYIFDLSYSDRLSFLAGIIDADGYIASGNTQKVQIGSTNQELAMSEFELAQSLGYTANVYVNHYSKRSPDKVRYMVEFDCSDDIVSFLQSSKKVNNYVHGKRNNRSVSDDNTCSVIDVQLLNKEDYSYDVQTESSHFTVNGLYSHNCRAFLTPDRFTDEGFGNTENRGNYEEGKHRYYGRFNQGAVTINLPDVALSSHKDKNEFWKILNERLDLCHRAIRLRHDRLKGTPSDVAPILWQDGAVARLKPGETIDKLLYKGYSTISLGYAGLAECVYYMTGCSHTEKAGKEFGVSVMKKLNDACASWKAAENIDYSLYGTPIESTTYKFAKCLQRRFGIIEGVTDKGYITNSYHIKVTEQIDAFSKLTKEAEFQVLSPGGAVSYVEVPNMQNNIPAIIALLKHMYNTILYAEINTKSDLCENCGFDGEMQIVDDNGHLSWVCPKCGNKDESKMHIARRTCGYIGTQYWNQGRTQEIKDRVLHL